MAKRYTDTDKWKKSFIRGLDAPYKLLWFYILDECDHAGVWHVDFAVAKIRTGEKLNYEKAIAQLGTKIYPFDDNEKWFIPDFITFQYGELNPENRVHHSVISLLEKYSLITEDKELVSPLYGAKDKDKDMDKDKDKEKEPIPIFKKLFIKPSLDEVKAYCLERHNNVDPDKWLSHYESNGWLVGKNKMKDWKAAVRTWEKNNYETPVNNQSPFLIDIRQK